MGWDDDYEYSNGADGSCQVCGEPTDEEWHTFCRDCFADQQGWTRRDDDDDGRDGVPSPAFPGDDRWKVAYLAGFRVGWQAALEEQARWDAALKGRANRAA
jgi:hypothetical protein